MLVSISVGFCRDGLVSAILLRALMLVVIPRPIELDVDGNDEGVSRLEIRFTALLRLKVAKFGECVDWLGFALEPRPKCTNKKTRG
jgi:hypothetical protein